MPKVKRNLKPAKVFFNYLIFFAKSLALNQAFSTLGPLNQSPQHLIYIFYSNNLNREFFHSCKSISIHEFFYKIILFFSKPVKFVNLEINLS